MTTTVLPPAGWYTDPEHRADQRFWDGANWTEHLRGAMRVPSAEPVFPVQPAPNRIAVASLVLGITALFANLLLVPSLLAMIFGLRGLRRQDRRGRGVSIAGLVLGGVAVPLSLMFLFVAVPFASAFAHGWVEGAAKASMLHELSSRGVDVVKYSCSFPAGVAQGTGAECNATDSHGQWWVVDVDFTDSNGDYSLISVGRVTQ